MMRFVKAILLLVVGASVAGCQTDQSALSAASYQSSNVLWLTWILIVGGTVILVGVTALIVVAIFGSAKWRKILATDRVILAGGLVFPITVLSLLLAYVFYLMSLGGVATGAEDPFRVTIIGERFWWRAIYTASDGKKFETANEFAIPTDHPVRFQLETNDVIHSFWVPRLAGKIDMIPGRVNVLNVEATSAGLYRGQCAEYCGGAHARMAFNVRALASEKFEEWVDQQSSDARQPQTASQSRGKALFNQRGCGGCHTIRGTEANGSIGPDLTHVGSRSTLAAATLPNQKEQLVHWIRNNQDIKPTNRMLSYESLPLEEVEAIAVYLKSLK